MGKKNSIKKSHKKKFLIWASEFGGKAKGSKIAKEIRKSQIKPINLSPVPRSKDDLNVASQK